MHVTTKTFMQGLFMYCDSQTLETDHMSQTSEIDHICLKHLKLIIYGSYLKLVWPPLATASRVIQMPNVTFIYKTSNS